MLLQWDVMPDDQHFVMIKPDEASVQMTVVTNCCGSSTRSCRLVSVMRSCWHEHVSIGAALASFL
jgi:hypothetical protein